MVYGDPHFATFDGVRYTFNGLGEFTLSRTVSGAEATKVTISGHFQKVSDASGRSSQPVLGFVCLLSQFRTFRDFSHGVKIESHGKTPKTLSTLRF